MSWDDYKTAVVRVHLPNRTYEVRARGSIASCDGPFPDEARKGGLQIITAHNPNGQTVTEAENDEAHARLLAEVTARGLDHWDAVGGDPAWQHTERSLAIAGLTDDEARELGDRYGQEAIFGWQPTAWSLLACRGSRARMTGWVATRLPSADATPTKRRNRRGEPPSAPTWRPGAASAPTHPAATFRTVDHPGDPLDNIDGEVLADLQWELGGGGGSPGNADSGTVYLVRSADGYVTVQAQDGEAIVDPLDAADDTHAVRLFLAKAAASETVTVYNGLRP